MNSIAIHPLAKTEYERKIVWLKRNGILLNAAELFAGEIEAALDELAQLTHHRPVQKMPGHVRIGPTPKFRYSLIYQVEDASLNVVAIASPERRPGYWRRRKF